MVLLLEFYGNYRRYCIPFSQSASVSTIAPKNPTVSAQFPEVAQTKPAHRKRKEKGAHSSRLMVKKTLTHLIHAGIRLRSDRSAGSCQ